MKRILICLITILISTTAHSQRGNNWVFGYHGGITFNTEPPSIISTSLAKGITSNIGPHTSTSMSDCNGNLLFYGTNKQIWNKNHQPMYNGTFPNSASYGSIGQFGCLVIPVPDSVDLYYYFYCGSSITKNIYYALIDTRLDNGNGGVSLGQEANLLISDQSTFFINATPHANGKDIWVIFPYGNDSIVSVLATSTGINQMVKSKKAEGAYDFKISPNGKSIVFTGFIAPTNTVAYIYDFDNATGKISNEKTIIIPHNSSENFYCSAPCFSPDSRLLYITTGRYDFTKDYINKVYQFTLDKLQGRVIASLPLKSGGCLQNYITSLQLAPNGKLYGAYNMEGSAPVSCYSGSSLAVINSPNTIGSACDFELIPFNIGTSGLPFFYYRNYFVDMDVSTDICTKDTAQRIILKEDSGKYFNYILYYGDGDSTIVTNPFTNNADTFYHYYAEGTYTLKVKTVNNECSYTKDFEKDITIRFKPEIYYGFDTDSSACWEHHFKIKDSSLLATGTKLLWGNGKISNGEPNGTMAEYYAAEDTFTYTYIAFNTQCADTVTGQLITKFLPKPNVRLGVDDSAFCQDESFTLTDTNTDVVNRLVNWGDGITDNLISHTYLDTGTFNVFVTDTATNGCANTDSITLSAEDIKLISAGALDFTQACEDVAMEYAYTFFNADSLIIEWGDGSSTYTNQFIDLVNHTYSTGSYAMRIMVFNSQCLDTVFGKPVELLPYPKAIASVADNKLCMNDSIAISNTSTGASSYKVLWGDLDEGNYPINTSEFTHTYETKGLVNAEVIALNAQGCADTTDVDINVLPLPAADFSTDVDSGCRPLNLGITNASKDYLTYFINWGDGSGDIPNGAFNHTYPNKGSYPISLGVSNGYCADTAYGSIKVTGLSGVEPSAIMVATVNGPKAVYVEWDPVQGASGYNLYRSVDGVNYTLIAKKIGTTNYFDAITTEANSWYYKVQGVDSCDNLSLESNLGRTIFLEGENVGKNQAAFLKWNAYQDWASGVLVYQLEVQDEFGGFYNLANQQTLFKEDTDFLDLKREEKCYRVVAYEKDGNNAVSTSNTVCLPYKPLLWAPNAFSPNGDGNNDTWGVMHLAMEEISFTIYNRWGEIVYESKYPTDTWDGKDAPVGVYMYIVRGKAINGKPFFNSGEIHLVR